MHGVFRGNELEASKACVSSAAENLTDDKSVAEDWFANVCKQLLPTKAGTALHYATGFDERSCQRYAAGDVKPPAYFFLCLLRNPQGWTWLCAAMDGCSEPWWREVWTAVECARAFDARRKEIDSA